MDLVCFSHLKWNFVYQRPQHLMRRFATRYRVFFIQEFCDDPSGDGYGITQSEEQVWIVTPYLRPGDRDNERDRQRKVIDQLFREQQVREYVCWYYTPISMLFSDHLQPMLTIYDCMDELAAFKFADPQLGKAEQLLFSKADLVFTGGNSLYEAKKYQHPNVHSFPSSIDHSHFSISRGSPQAYADQEKIPRPRLGFFGVIDERFDIELVAGSADLEPDWHFILIGPVVKIDPGILPRRDNLHYLGSRTYKELPGYLAGWDIALIPFALNESTRYISPTKTPEYLAAGKPVISTAITDVIHPYGEMGLVHIVANAAELVEKAREELQKSDRSEWLSKVDAQLATNSWDITWGRMEELMERELQNKATSRYRAKEHNKTEEINQSLNI